MTPALIPKKVRPWMLLFGIFATAIGVSEIATFLPRALGGSVVDAVYAVFWVMFLGVYWLAYSEKLFGAPRFWKICAPLLIVADVSSILFLDLSADYLEVLTGVVVSLVLSTPLYLALWWYAFVFLPARPKK
jgi:hypothetical protein